MAVPCAEVLKHPKKVVLTPFLQKTLNRSISISGIGLFTGEKSVLTIQPAQLGTGLVFQRIDLKNKPEFVADLDHVVSTPRCTILGNQQCTIHTVEHILAALGALGINNARLLLDGPEVPILDGSSKPFAEALLEAGITEQEKKKPIHVLKSPVNWSKDEVHLIAVPSEEFRVSYTLHFPKSTILRSQFYSAAITPDKFIQEIAPCRTFCHYEEIVPFIENGMIKGGGLDNAVIIKNDVIVNPEGVRFSDEMVRHKVLDLIGDLSLMPLHLQAHIVAIRSGHASNIAFARKLMKHITREKS